MEKERVSQVQEAQRVPYRINPRRNMPIHILISELEDKIVEITSEEQKKVKRMERNGDSLRDLWENIKCTNIQIIGVPEEEEKKKGYEKILNDIRVENSPVQKRRQSIKSKRHKESHT